MASRLLFSVASRRAALEGLMRSTHFVTLLVIAVSAPAFAQTPPPPGPPAGGGTSTSGGPPPGPPEGAPAVAPAPPVMYVLPPVTRVGLELGGGVWGGKMYCESQNGKCNGFSAAGGINLEGSWFFTPALGITLDVWPMAHTENAVTITHVISTVGIKWRPLPMLTLQAGIGDAHATFSFANVTVGTTDDAAAVMAGISLDIVRGRRWALAIGARAGTGFYGDANNDGKADVTARSTGIGAEFTAFGF
jgi:hypothetical protein